MAKREPTRRELVLSYAAAAAIVVGVAFAVCGGDAEDDAANEGQWWVREVGPGTALTQGGAGESAESQLRAIAAAAVSRELDTQSPGAAAVAVGPELQVLQYHSALCSPQHLGELKLAWLRQHGFERVECTDGDEIWFARVPASE